MSKKYRVREKQVVIGTYFEKFPCSPYDYTLREVSEYETRYNVMKWNRVVKTYRTKAPATKLKNKLEREG